MNRHTRFRFFIIGLALLMTACSSTPPRQPSDPAVDDLRPDYRFVSVNTTELTGMTVYSAEIANAGRSYVYKQEDPPKLTIEATAFYLFANNRIRYVTQTTRVDDIEGGGVTAASFQFNKTMRLKLPDGRRESSLGTWVMFLIDPANAVFEQNEQNNTTVKK